MKNLIPYEFGVTGHWHSAFDPKASRQKRVRKLLRQDSAALITEICQHYIAHFIPNPVENEALYWIMSCYPSTDKSLVRVSIWFPEVFNISAAKNYFGYGDQLQCMIFLHRDFVDYELKEQLKDRIPGLRFIGAYKFRTGIDRQLAVFLPLESYFEFVGDERIYEAARVHNYELSLKGKTPFKRGHNYEFVRYLYGDSSYVEDLELD